MSKILITMDDINYGGGAHYATFHIANILSDSGHEVSIYTPTKATERVRSLISSTVTFPETKDFNGYDTIMVPFENSLFREEVAKVDGVFKVQWIHIEYEKWMNTVSIDLDAQRRLFLAYDKIVFVSEHNQKSFLNVFPEFSEKCCVAYNYLDVSGIQNAAHQQIDYEIFSKRCPQQLNIVVSGRLEPQKAYHRLVDTAKILAEQGLIIEWFILGTGYEYDELRSRCEKYSLNNIHFLGFRKNPYAYMKQADVFALLSDYEGLALVIAESLCLGVPVVSTKSGGVKEVLDEKYGWIIDNSISEIVSKLTELYYNRELLDEKRMWLENYVYDNERVRRSVLKIFGAESVQRTENNMCDEVKKMTISMNNYDKKALVSIVVPVYNMENYLVECLESLVNQTMDEIEIVIVNDGSTDGSQRIIDNYVFRYSEKIRAFTIENSGLGEARNYGISKARGNYLCFVDSDDIIKRNMVEVMYHAALRNHADCIVCDYIATWPSGREEYVSSVPLQDPDRFDILRYSAKYGVVNACTKLVDRKLFENIKFPKGFYEDLATMPIVLSYANKIHYVREGLYYYRQRSGSITSIKNNDKRLLDCYKAWDRILKESNPVFKKEITFAVYWSMNFFCTDFLDDFTDKSKAYFEKHKEVFFGNEYIQRAISQREFLDFERMEEIPRIIHFCWFGGNEKSELIKQCIASWKKFAPDFQLMEWNESNCDIHENSYVEEAYSKKQYAFVSDYFRLKALYEHGGIYMDTDMELMKPIEPYCFAPAFFAFETPIYVHAGIIGAVPRMNFFHDVLNTYKNDAFTSGEGGVPKTICMRLTELLERDPSFIKNGKNQTLSNGIKIYSANKMTLNFHDGHCVANHHYAASWLNRNEQASSADYSYEVMKHFFTWDLLQRQNQESMHPDPELISQRDFYKNKCEMLENSTCWKITKPIRIVADFIKRIIKR